MTPFSIAISPLQVFPLFIFHWGWKPSGCVQISMLSFHVSNKQEIILGFWKIIKGDFGPSTILVAHENLLDTIHGIKKNIQSTVTGTVRTSAVTLLPSDTHSQSTKFNLGTIRKFWLTCRHSRKPGIKIKPVNYYFYFLIPFSTGILAETIIPTFRKKWEMSYTVRIQII